MLGWARGKSTAPAEKLARIGSAHDAVRAAAALEATDQLVLAQRLGQWVAGTSKARSSCRLRHQREHNETSGDFAGDHLTSCAPWSKSETLDWLSAWPTFTSPAVAPAAPARSHPTGTEAPATAKTPAASMPRERGDVACREPLQHLRRLAGP